MNQSELENKIQFESDKYVFDLEKRYGQQSEFKNALITFLNSKSHRFFLLEGPDTSASAWRLLQVLKELQSVPELTVLNDYLGTKNQTMLKWGKLSEILKSSEAVPKLKNLLTCEFDQSVELFSEDEKLIRTIMERISLSVKGKIIYISSSKHNIVLRKVKSDSVIYFNESENKTMPIYDISTESLTERVSVDDVSAVERLLVSGVDINGYDLNRRTALHAAAIYGRLDLAVMLLRNGAKHLPDKNKYKSYPIHYAAQLGYKDIVELFLENDIIADINMKGYKGRTALHFAAESGNPNLVLTLLKHGASNLPDELEDTPLHCAAKYDHEEVVELFLKNDIIVDVNMKGYMGRTALHFAAASGHKNLVLTLLKHGANHLPDGSRDTPLHYAAEQGHENVVKPFLENDNKGFRGQTALHDAATSGHTDLVLTLLKHGAKHLPDKNGDTPLHCAAIKGNEEIVKLFLENDIDVNMKGFNQRTALHYAAINNHKNVVSTLLKHGANHLPDGIRNTPLHCAAEHGHKEVVELLLENDIDVNIKGFSEQTALHYAATSGHTDLVLTLLKHGANHLPDKNGNTPLHYAAMDGHEEVVKLFLENEGMVNIKGQGGKTALHYAVSKGYKGLIVTLVKKGADINLKNDEAKTALDLAQNQKDIIKLLKEKRVKN